MCPYYCMLTPYASSIRWLTACVPATYNPSVRKLPNEARRYFASWGRKGGKARASRLTPEQRKEIARKAARTRWEKAKRQTGKR